MRRNKQKASPLGNQAFRKWFGESVVVGDDGEPVVVYHGTFSKFVKPQVNFGKDEYRRFGFHVGSLEAATNRLALKAAEDERDRSRSDSSSATILPLFVRAENPLRLEENRSGRWGVDDIVRAMMDQAASDGVDGIDEDMIAAYYEDALEIPGSGGRLWSEPFTFRDGERTDILIRFLRSIGYDSIVYENEFEGGGDSYILLSPTQVKSATDNDGSFDSDDPDFTSNRSSKVVNEEAFRRWFGNSVVVDTDGEPLVVYHGGFDVESAKLPAFRHSKRSGYGTGIYLTPMRDVAEAYAEENKGVVGSYYARVENPLIVRWNGAVQALVDLGWTPKKAEAKIEREEEQYGGIAGVIQSAARDKGYDGLFVLTKDASTTLPEKLDVPRDVREIVLFDGGQVKSATKNVGTFERWSADVTRNPGRTFIPPEMVALEAEYGLWLRSQQPPSNRCCTPVGIARAKQLKNRQPLSIDTLKRMRSYFQRHEVDKMGANWGVDSKGFQAWLLWGGDSGRDWCNRILDQLGE